MIQGHINIISAIRVIGCQIGKKYSFFSSIFNANYLHGRCLVCQNHWREVIYYQSRYDSRSNQHCVSIGIARMLTPTWLL